VQYTSYTVADLAGYDPVHTWLWPSGMAAAVLTAHERGWAGAGLHGSQAVPAPYSPAVTGPNVGWIARVPIAHASPDESHS